MQYQALPPGGCRGRSHNTSGFQLPQQLTPWRLGPTRRRSSRWTGRQIWQAG